MNCPICQNVQLVMAERHGIEIDYCPKCRGVWLDRGELDKIIERTSQVVPQAPVQPPQQNYPQPPLSSDDSHYGYTHKRKKSWLGELFD